MGVNSGHRCRYNEVRRTPLLILEIVRGFPITFLEENLPSFDLTAILTQPADVKVKGTARDRVYYVGQNKFTAKRLACPLKVYLKMVAYIATAHGPHDAADISCFYMAPRAEVHDEVAQFACESKCLKNGSID